MGSFPHALIAKGIGTEGTLVSPCFSTSTFLSPLVSKCSRVMEIEEIKGNKFHKEQRELSEKRNITT